MAIRQPPVRLPANLALVGIACLGLLLAVVAGSLIGNNDPTQLLIPVAVALVVLFAAGLYRYVWHTSLFLVFFGFAYRPTGFSFGPLELSCALGASLILLFIWQNKRTDRPEVLTDASVNFLQYALFAWLLYVGLHLLFNITMPYRASEFVFSNSIKSYFAVSAPLVILFCFVRSPAGLVVRKDFFWTISRLCLLGLLLNLSIRFYEFAGGGAVYIPLLNGTPDVYALRTLGPLAMMLGIVGITAPNGPKTLFRFATFWTLLAAGGMGSAVSGGRATLVIGILSVCAILVMRRKVMSLFVVITLGILGAAIANLCADWINNDAEPFVQRSLQWVLLNKKGAESQGIESSSNWRRELFYRALDEWRSDPRIFWTGRATYGFGVADDTAVLIAGGYEAMIETALRRGATHNLISDLLVTYGIVGLFLYLTVYVAIVRFLWKLYRMRSLSGAAANLTLACLIGSLIWFVYSVLGGNFYSIEYIWFLVILVGACHCEVALEERRSPAPRNPRPYLKRPTHTLPHRPLGRALRDS